MTHMRFLSAGVDNTGIGSVVSVEASAWAVWQPMDRNAARQKRNLWSTCAVVGALLFGICTSAAAQFAAQAVGTTSGSSSVTGTVEMTGTVAQVEIVTAGAPNLPSPEFAPGTGSSTCIGSFLSVGSNWNCAESVAFTPAFPGMRIGAVVLLDATNNVLGTACLWGVGQGPLGVLTGAGKGVSTPENMVTIAGVSRTWTSTKDGILATSANLDQPAGTAVDGAGNIYISDSANNKIRVVTSPQAQTQPGYIWTYAGTGDSGRSDGPAASATFSSPAGLALDGAGNLYVADTGNNVVRKIAAATGMVSTVAGNGTPGYLGDNGQATAAELNLPWGVTVDRNGNLYIADTGNQRVRRVDAVSGTITTVAGNGDQSGLGDGKGTDSGDGGPATSAGLSVPYAIAFDNTGNMYIADSANNRIRKVDTSGIITTYAGAGQAGYSGDTLSATAALLNTPTSVAVDPAGNVYIADSQNSAIRKVNAKYGTIGTVAVNGSQTKLDWNNNLAPPNMYAPMGLFLDGSGNLYFSDYFEMVVLKLTPALAVLDYRSTPVRQSDQSTPQVVQVENDGNLPFDLTQLSPGANAVFDSGTTTCTIGATDLAVGTSCNIGAAFAPTAAGNPLRGDLDIQNGSVNTPLDIALIGNATPVNSTTVVVTSSLNPSTFGQAVTFTASVTTGANTGSLTGTVTFTDGTTSIATDVPVNSSGVAVYTPSSLSVGAHSITATYSGDSKHFASTSSLALIQTVNEVTAVGLTASANPSAAGSSVTFTATVTTPSGGGVIPDGTVTFYDGSTMLGASPLNASAVATYSTQTLSYGPHSITAVYGGDAANYILNSNSTVLNQDVQAGSTMALTSTSNPSNYGLPITFSATVTSAGPSATGTLKFFDNGKQIGSASLSGTPGTASMTTSTLAVGTHPITATYAGDPYNSPSTSAAFTETVNQTVTTLAEVAVPDPGIAGAPVAITATLKVTVGAGTPTGSVSFTDGASTLGSAGLGSGGVATIHPMLAPGDHAIVATYGGDVDDAGSSTTPLTLTVQEATTSVALTSSANPGIVQLPIAFTIKVTSNGGVPTGSVALVADGATLGSVTLDATGAATFTCSTLSVGTHTLVANYAGDVNDLASSSPAISQVIQTIPTVTSLGTTTTAGVVPQLILLATVVGSSGPTPTGTVTFSTGSTVIGSAPLDSSGVASFAPDLGPGAYTVVAGYGGDALHSPSTSQATSITNPAAGFTITVAPSSLSVATTQNVTVNVNLSSITGFADTISLGCASLPAGVNCHFSALQASLASNSSATVQLIVDTNSPLSGGTSAMNARPANRTALLAGFFLPLPLLFGFAWRRFGKRHAAVFAATLLVWLCGVSMLLTGCSGFSQSSATPGTYTFQVVGVGINSNVSHYQNVSLTITK